MRRAARLRTSESIHQAAKALRRPMTPAEEVLWSVLRRNGVAGLHFRRQHPIGRFILDFYCAAKKLCIELDGPIHDEQHERDEARTQALAHQQIRVIRFRNEEVLSDLASVVRRIEVATEEQAESE
jgi:very-short-patch-repair endonuclease